MALSGHSVSPTRAPLHVFNGYSSHRAGQIQEGHTEPQVGKEQKATLKCIYSLHWVKVLTFQFSLKRNCLEHFALPMQTSTKNRLVFAKEYVGHFEMH